MRHHPEGRWRLQPADLNRYRDRLLALARQAVDLLAPGGRLMYATCSLEPEENEEVISELLQGDSSLAPLELAGGHQKTWLPHESETDGFFAARLAKEDLES
jgi:16S rRNA (cytosine967-C5)-methyltransferase